MEIKELSKLQSKGYRSLFEYIKKEGVEPVLNLMQDIKSLPNINILIYQAIMEKEYRLVELTKKHESIIKYLKEHENDFSAFHSQEQRDNILNVLMSLSNDINMLKVYLENAKRLEELNVIDISFVSSFDPSQYFCHSYRDDKGKIINIKKYYTDGIINANKETLVDEEFNYSEITFNDISNATFLLECNNTFNFYQLRNIIIKNFGFDGSKLPSEEELQSYEIPMQLIRK